MSAPRIHWVSPLPPARTDIAEYTRRILPALAARAEVVLWTDAAAWDEGLEAHASVRRFDPAAALPMDLRGLPPAGGREEAVFHQIGNSWVFHAGILALAHRVPGTVVLHDLALQESFRDMVANGLLERRLPLDEAARWYGEAGRRATERLLRGGPADPRDLARVPLPELALRGATGVLAHTGAAADHVAARAMLPVYRLDLPFRIGPPADPARASSGPLRLAQFGHIGPNRRLEPILAALGRVRDRVAFELDLFGALWDEGRIRRAAAAAGIAERVRFRGFAPEAELDACLRAAHLVFNLRMPTMGEASGSQLRIWDAAAASVVSDLGWYAELPPETVFRIDPEAEGAGLEALLLRLGADRALGAEKGRAGRARLEARHAPEAYAEAVVRLAAGVGADQRDALAARAGRAALAALPPGTDAAAAIAARTLAGRLDPAGS